MSTHCGFCSTYKHNDPPHLPTCPLFVKPALPVWDYAYDPTSASTPAAPPAEVSTTVDDDITEHVRWTDDLSEPTWRTLVRIRDGEVDIVYQRMPFRGAMRAEPSETGGVVCMTPSEARWLRDLLATADIGDAADRAARGPDWDGDVVAALWLSLPPRARAAMDTGDVEALLREADRLRLQHCPARVSPASAEAIEEIKAAARSRLEDSGIRPGSREHVDIWDTINAYAQACGGDTSASTVSARRMRAVHDVEVAIARARGAGSK